MKEKGNSCGGTQLREKKDKKMKNEKAQEWQLLLLWWIPAELSNKQVLGSVVVSQSENVKK